MLNLLKDLGLTVLGYLQADWYILLLGIMIAAILKVYVDTNKFKNYLDKNAKVSILGSIGFGAFTPLCACGTMAVILSMFFTSMPWGPVMAFLISSPLTSPSEYMFETAFFGSRFATMVVVSSILLGLLAGGLAHLLDKKTNFFKGQFRLADKDTDSKCCSKKQSLIESECCSTKDQGKKSALHSGLRRDTKRACCYENQEGVATSYGFKNPRGMGDTHSTDPKLARIKNSCCTEQQQRVASYPVHKKVGNAAAVHLASPQALAVEGMTIDCTCGTGALGAAICCEAGRSIFERLKLREFCTELVEIGLKKVLLYFVVFIAVGRIVEMVIPKEWIMMLFSANKPHSVILGATIGLPLYVSGPAALPLLKSFMASGAGQGALMAFLITGKATGLPVIAGLSTMLKKKALAFYVIFIYLGGILCGYLYQLFLNLH